MYNISLSMILTLDLSLQTIDAVHFLPLGSCLVFMDIAKETVFRSILIFLETPYFLKHLQNGSWVMKVIESLLLKAKVHCV